MILQLFPDSSVEDVATLLLSIIFTIQMYDLKQIGTCKPFEILQDNDFQKTKNNVRI